MSIRSFTFRPLLGAFLAAFLSAGGTVPASASERTIGWQDLTPTVEPYDDPFKELSYDQISDLRLVLLGDAPDAENAEDLEIKTAEARERLEAAGLDIEYLARQRDVVRERRTMKARGTNEAVLGEVIRMPGYLLPLRVNEQKVTEFLLVPTYGACIHTPPPPPNQVVHVLYPEGFEAKALFTPVWITGRLDANSSRQSVSYSDGQTQVDVAYRVEAVGVEKY